MNDFKNSKTSFKNDLQIINTMGRNNCGGRCHIRAHADNGKVVRITTETKCGDHTVPLTACLRGIHYYDTYFNNERFSFPLRRIGKRGEGKFKRISWSEAVDIIAEELSI